MHTTTVKVVARGNEHEFVPSDKFHTSVDGDRLPRNELCYQLVVGGHANAFAVEVCGQNPSDRPHPDAVAAVIDGVLDTLGVRVTSDVSRAIAARLRHQGLITDRTVHRDG